MRSPDLNAAAFPQLSEHELSLFEHCPLTKRKQYRAGEKLIDVGQRDVGFLVVKAGEVVIIDEDDSEQTKIITVHMPGQFTGEVAQLTGAPSLVSAVAQTDCEVFEISPDALQQVLNLHPDIGDVILQAFIARRQMLRESGMFTGLRVIGSRYSPDTFRLREFLANNLVPYIWLDVENDHQVQELLKQFGVSEQDMPIVVRGRSVLLRNPTSGQLADALGLRKSLEHAVYDLVVVGAGPGGLAAAVYGASEGLRTVVLERAAPGGQAGRSMRIENYLGFPTGITGSELAERAVIQIHKFGARLTVPTCVKGLRFDNGYTLLDIEGGGEVVTKTLLIATGADYRLLDAPGCQEFEGRGVYYAATPIEAQTCRGADVMVVGGGNSAGQAAVYLASQVNRVYMVVRADNLYKNMSSYLAQRIEQTHNIELLLNCEVGRIAGDQEVREVEIDNRRTGETRTLRISALFSFIGAMPRSDWLPAEIEKDDKGFIRTGPALAQTGNWTSGRQPFLLETTRRAVFAAGDVRSGSVKRVASAVGEGAMAVQFVHECLREM